MSKFRTKKSNRATYIYRDAYGQIVATLHPGENGVTEADIMSLHRADDEVHNLEKKDSYHGLWHYQHAEDISLDRQTSLANESANPESLFFTAFDIMESDINW